MTHQLDATTNAFCMACDAEKNGRMDVAERLFHVAAEEGITKDTPEKLDPGTMLWFEGASANDEGDYALAEKKFLAAANLGKSSAMNSLATLYDDYVASSEPLKAIHWYVRAYRAGDQLAAWNLAMHFVARANHRWYCFWMRKAVESGHDEASVEMARIEADPIYMTELPFEAYV